jgi:hypothetical protein
MMLLPPGESQKRKSRPVFWIRLILGLVSFLITLVIILSILGYPHPHNPVSRERGEIKAMSAALESYKADNGHYPSDPQGSDLLRPAFDFTPDAYIRSSAFLYRALSGDTDGVTLQTSGSDAPAVYMAFKPVMLRKAADGQTYIVDPWGNSIGYSTFEATHPGQPGGFNSEYDLWSTGGSKSRDGQSHWVTNWSNN